MVDHVTLQIDLLSFSASLYGLQDLLLYQPDEPDTSRIIVQTPDMYNMPYETIVIETADHEKLHGFLIKQTHHAEECETLLFFHGNAGNIGHR
jgi:abhydrolase domain-containing protein 13